MKLKEIIKEYPWRDWLFWSVVTTGGGFVLYLKDNGGFDMNFFLYVPAFFAIMFLWSFLILILISWGRRK